MANIKTLRDPLGVFVCDLFRLRSQTELHTHLHLSFGLPPIREPPRGFSDLCGTPNVYFASKIQTNLLGWAIQKQRKSYFIMLLLD